MAASLSLFLGTGCGDGDNNGPFEDAGPGVDRSFETGVGRDAVVDGEVGRDAAAQGDGTVEADAGQAEDGGTRVDGGKGRPLIGVIRWDAWQEDGTINSTVESTLQPEHWHYRIPFFGEVDGQGEVHIHGNLQAVMDQEIAHASAAGIDFWAFVTYPPSNGMSNGLNLYLASTNRDDIGFCLLLQGGWLAWGELSWTDQVDRYVNLFSESEYVRVAGDRPLLFLFDIESMWNTTRFSTEADVRAAIEELRDASRAAGTGDPYVVLQGWSPADDAVVADSIGLDALSSYAVVGGSSDGAPYASLMVDAENIWESARATGCDVVPILGAGWDPRPRIETPTPWVTYQEIWYDAPTPAELSAHIEQGLAWIRTHRGVVRADVALLYAWNEHDEGGWVCPTWTPTGPDTSYVGAVASGIEAYEAKLWLENGSFEAPEAATGWYVVPAEGMDVSFGWSTGAAPQAYVIADSRALHFSAAAEGEQALLLASVQWIQQEVGILRSGEQVELHFAALTGVHDGDTPGTFRAEFLLDGVPLASMDVDTPTTPGQWESHVLTARASTTGILDVRFENISGMSWLDAVAVHH